MCSGINFQAQGRLLDHWCLFLALGNAPNSSAMNFNCGGKEKVEQIESSIDINTAVCKIDSWWEGTVQCRELSMVLCADLEGWDEGTWEGGTRERGHMNAYG